MEMTFQDIIGSSPTEIELWHAYKDTVPSLDAKRVWATRALESLPTPQFINAKRAIDAQFDSEEQHALAQYRTLSGNPYGH
jgi:hypothetical protein